MGSSGSNQGQKKEGKNEDYAVKTIAVGAFGLLLLWGFSRFGKGDAVSAYGNNWKLMKAPGRTERAIHSESAV